MALPLFAAHTTGVLLAVFGSAALLLATIGLSGVVSYSVSQRTNEIGVRMALGADRLDVVRLILKQGMRLTGIGLVLGLVLSFAATRVLSALRNQARRPAHLRRSLFVPRRRRIHILLCACAQGRVNRSDEIAAGGISNSIPDLLEPRASEARVPSRKRYGGSRGIHALNTSLQSNRL